MLIGYEKTKDVAVIFYDTVGRPIVQILYQKYKVVEDAAFIYVMGPSVKTILNCIPEKNPFCDEDDSDLDEFMPGPVGDANVADEDEVTVRIDDASYELPEEIQLHDEDLDDLDDDSFLTKRLQHDFSGTDSSDEEFLLFPKKTAQKRTISKSSS